MQIPTILESTNLWFVVGLGDNPDRAAFGVAKFLQVHGKQIVPIYLRAEIVHGEQGFATISEAKKVWGPPEVVDLFVSSSRAGQLSDQGVQAGAKVIWMQLGITDEAAAERARNAGLTVVMNRCPVIDWRKTSHWLGEIALFGCSLGIEFAGVIFKFLRDCTVSRPQHASSQKPRIFGVVNSHRCHGNPCRHLDDRK